MRPFTDVSLAMRFLPKVAFRLECAISNAAYDRDIRLGPTFERPLSPPARPKADLPLSAKSRRRVTVRIELNRQWRSVFST